ncbi:MAG: hypothetical protein ASARMPREDX12_006267 [Alectoria sarmentosa]|nr:MAG: hypothetical protein ASARMPRED_005539 [Alectoria sarmentosa]CAD6592596.1 MAG: hypothetical protein ASARMPREDX12_006267 [Alectoria sarmentosa]
MNQMNMGGFNAGNGALGNMPMPNHGPNGVGGRMPDDHEDTNYEAKLNAYIYGYFCVKGKWELARALKDSGVEFEPPLVNDNANGANDSMQTDSKDGIDLKRPDDLPDINLGDGQGGSFLSSWFALFWDIFSAQRKSNRASANAMQYVTQTQQQARMRSEQQTQMLRAMPGMGPGQLENYQQMLRFQQNTTNGNLQRKALENNRGQFQPTAHQLAQMQRQGMMQGMRRDPSDMDMNGQRPRTPSAGDHAPSPNKRQRMDSVPFNGAPHMMQNGRGPPQMMGGDSALNANHLLMNNGINPGNLSDSQFASFQQQNPAVQQKSIQVYAQNLAKNQRQQSMSNAGGMSDQGSPLMPPGMEIGVGGPEFYGGGNPGAMQMRGGVPPGAPNGGAGGNHALQDYQMQLMLLEQQNKKRLLMARQEQDTIGSGRPDGPGGMPGAQGFAPGMSPSGSRGGPSPGPSDQARRGTPKMPQTTGLPGSPMPDGSMRGSPAAMPFNPMQPEMYPHMNGGAMRPPPSSHPQFSNGGQYTQEQMVAIQKAQNGGRMNGNWQQGPQGQAPMIQAPQPQQGVQMGTPQQRTEMPPPQAVPNAATNGRPASPTAPPTPQTTSKANPKGKKDARERKKPAKKGSTASVPPTPASEAEQPPTPTPATPVTPQHSASFAPSKPDGQGPANMMPGIPSAAPDQLAPQQQDTAMSGFNGLDGGVDESYSMPFNSDLNNSDILENFDFEQFLQTTDGDFNFDPSTFETGDGIEIGGGS